VRTPRCQIGHHGFALSVIPTRPSAQPLSSSVGLTLLIEPSFLAGPSPPTVASRFLYSSTTLSSVFSCQVGFSIISCPLVAPPPSPSTSPERQFQFSFLEVIVRKGWHVGVTRHGVDSEAGGGDGHCAIGPSSLHSECGSWARTQLQERTIATRRRIGDGQRGERFALARHRL